MSKETPLPPNKIAPLLAELSTEWTTPDHHHLHRQLDFPDFALALAFVNQVGELAEREGHHPDLALSWGKVVVTIWTHDIGGLAELDFVLATKIERLFSGKA